MSTHHHQHHFFFLLATAFLLLEPLQLYPHNDHYWVDAFIIHPSYYYHNGGCRRKSKTTTESFTPFSSSSTLAATYYNDFGDDGGLIGGDDFSSSSSSSSRESPRGEEDNDDTSEKSGQQQQPAEDMNESIYAALRERQATLDAEKKDVIDETWKHSPTTMHAVLLRPSPSSFEQQVDWVRRIAIDTGEMSAHQEDVVVVGGSSGSLYLINLETAQQFQLPNIHESRGGLDDLPMLCHYMYGDYDGGGIVALARKDNLVASSGREGGVHLSVIINDDSELVSLGRINPGDDDEINKATATSLVFDPSSDVLWVGTFEDGMIRGYNMEDLIMDDEEDSDDLLTTKASNNNNKNNINLPLLYEIKAKSGILNLAIEEEIGCGVAATARDGIIVFSLLDGKPLTIWNPFDDNDADADEEDAETYAESTKDGEFTFTIGHVTEFARSVALVQNDQTVRNVPPIKIPNPQDPTKQAATIHPVPSWSVVVGGSKGSLHQRQLSILPNSSARSASASGTSSGTCYSVNANKPWHLKMGGKPHRVPKRFCHQGPIVSLISPGPGILLSGGQDGTIRGWDCSYLQQNKVCLHSGKFEPDMWLEGWFGSGSKPSYIFGLSGYKVWLGSLVILNGDVLVTDGADNAVIAHYFGEE